MREQKNFREGGCHNGVSSYQVKSELLPFYFPGNHQKTKAFMISGGIEVNSFPQIRLILEVQFRNDP